MNLKDEITLFGRIDWTTYGLRTITVDDAVSIIRNGNYFIDDSRRSRMSGTLKEITEQGRLTATSLSEQDVPKPMPLLT